jgi:hypothetical protein
MRVAVVSSVDLRTPARFLVQSLRESGHQVIVISDVTNEFVDMKVSPTFSLVEVLSSKNFNADLLLYIEGGTMDIFPLDLNKMECTTVWWGIDSHLNFEKHLRISKLFDHTFLAQKDFVAQLNARGISSASWLPLAFPTSIQPTTSRSTTVDFAFVGQTDKLIYPERARILKLLSTHFPNNFIGTAEPMEMLEIYANSKIVINQSIKNDINMRFFEAMGTSALLVTNEIVENGFEDLFENGKHLLTFRDDIHLLEIVNAQLGDENQRNSMVRNANELIATKHTYNNRAQELISVAQALKKKVRFNQFEYAAVLDALDAIPEALALISKSMFSSNSSRRRRLIVIAVAFNLRLSIFFGRASVKMLETLKNARSH